MLSSSVQAWKIIATGSNARTEKGQLRYEVEYETTILQTANRLIFIHNNYRSGARNCLYSGRSWIAICGEGWYYREHYAAGRRTPAYSPQHRQLHQSSRPRFGFHPRRVCL